MRKLAILMILTVGLNVACSQEKKTEGTILATVNGENLTLEDILYQLPAEYRAQMTPESINDIVENWINTEVLYQQAVAKGIDKDPEIQAIIKAGTREAVARKFVDVELTNRVNVPMSEVDSIYNARRQLYKVDKNRYRASHILLSSSTEADAVYNRLVKGDDFAKLADDYSLDRRSAQQGGDIGYFTADSIDPIFAEAARKLSVGAYSKPIETQYGFHIIKLTDMVKAGSDLDSLEAKRGIQDSLYTEQHGKAFDDLLRSFKSSATISREPLSDSILTQSLGSSLP